jgi:hypothetical protein
MFDFDKETQSLTFTGGKFTAGYDENGNELNLTVHLVIYKDGLVANTESSTVHGDKFLEDLIDSVVKRFDLVPPSDISRKLYFSEIDVGLDKPLILLNPKLERIVAKLSELKVGPLRSV